MFSELIFVYGLKLRLRFFLLAYECPIIQEPFVEKPLLIYSIDFLPFLKIGRTYLCGSTWFLFCSIDLGVYISANTTSSLFL